MKCKHCGHGLNKSERGYFHTEGNLKTCWKYDFKEGSSSGVTQVCGCTNPEPKTKEMESNEISIQ